MRLRTPFTLTGALLGVGVLVAPATAVPSRGSPDQNADPMTSYVMERDGKTEPEAAAHPQAKDDKQSTLRSLEKKGVTTDGAWFSGSQLVVGVSTSADATKVRAAGLRASTTAGQSELDAIAVVDAASYCGVPIDTMN